ncbi:hypothetical protein OG501_34135 [Streptomyces niveus]
MILAVRKADSRLATALRYARAQQVGLNGRFTSRSGHEQCYRALVPDQATFALSTTARRRWSSAWRFRQMT